MSASRRALNTLLASLSTLPPLLPVFVASRPGFGTMLLDGGPARGLFLRQVKEKLRDRHDTLGIRRRALLIGIEPDREAVRVVAQDEVAALREHAHLREAPEAATQRGKDKQDHGVADGQHRRNDRTRDPVRPDGNERRQQERGSAGHRHQPGEREDQLMVHGMSPRNPAA
jgi:hypothetical protein